MTRLQNRGRIIQLTNTLTMAVAPQAEVPICVTCRSQASRSDQIMQRGGSTHDTLDVLEDGPGSDPSAV